MSVSTDLDLDLDPALNAIRRLDRELNDVASGFGRDLTRAIEAATGRPVRVTGDATELTGDVEGALDAADENVTITGDATEVTGDIEGAIDAADENVVVTADAGDVTGSIDAAVTDANTDITITADAGDLDDITAGADDASGALLGTAAAGAGVGTALKAGLAGVGAAAAVAFGKSLIDAASDVVESQNKVNVVFGESAGVITAFAENAAQSVGLSRQAALEAAGTFGNLFQALGTSREEATRMSTEVVTLSADLASFNNIGTDEALERLRSGLVGEIEPLRRMGISFGAAQVEAKALELGLASATGEVSEGAKVQARFALVMEQTTAAQGDFARTSEDLANKQRIVAADMENAQAAAGEALLPAYLALLSTIQDVIPAAIALAQALGPVLGGAITVLSATIDGALIVLEGFAGLLATLAGNEMVLVVAGAVGMLVAFRQLSAALAALKLAVASHPLGAIATVAAAAATAIGVFGGESQDAVLDVTAFGNAVEAAGGELDEFSVKAARQALSDAGVLDDLRHAGVSYEELADAIEAVGEGADAADPRIARVVDKIEQSGGDTFALGRALKELGIEYGVSSQAADDAAAVGFGAAEEGLKADADAAAAAEQALTDFIETVQGQLPTVGGIFKQAADDASQIGAALSPEQFAARLSESLVAIQNFANSIAVIISKGGEDTARVIAEAGPMIGGAFALQLAFATPEVVAFVEQAVDSFRTGGQAAVDQIAASFGGEIPTEIKAAIPTLAQSGFQAGSETAGGFDAGHQPDPTPGLQNAADHIASFGGAAAVALTIGRVAGENFVTGIIVGLANRIGFARAAAAGVVREMKAAADAEARASSPSLLFAELGQNISAGLAKGINDDSLRVVRAAESIVAQAARVIVPTANTVAAGTSIGTIRVEVNGVADPALARAAGRAAGQGIAEGLSTRRTVVGVRTG